MVKKIASILLLVLIVLSVCACGNTNVLKSKINSRNILKNCLTTIDGNTNVEELSFKSSDSAIANMKKVSSNNSYELYYSETSMNVAVRNKKSGETYFSNPYDANSDKGFSGDVAKLLTSQVVISYIGDDYNKHTLYSSADCGELGQYTIEEYENGVAFNLSLGKEMNSRVVPLVFTKATYEKILDSLSEDDKETLSNYYELYAEDELEDNGVLDTFPNIKKQSVYFCSYELNERETDILAAVFENTKLSKESVEKEYENLGLKYEFKVYPNFKLKLEYSLTEEGLTVNIPNNSIKFDSEFTLVDISVLPYFGTDKPKNNGKGYLLFPDGSGSIININGQSENRRKVISGRVYGQDGSLISSLENNNDAGKQIYLPVFGIVRNDKSGFFAVISDGDEYSELYANLGEPNGSYYTVYNKFIYCDSALYTVVSKIASVNSNNSIYLTSKNYAQSDFTIEYNLLNKSNSNLKTMAKIYKDKLFGEKEEISERKTINLISIGSVLCDSTVVGFKVKKETAFTTFSDNMSVISKIKDLGADSISLLLTGWSKNGLDASVSNGAKISSVLGGKSKLKDLISFSEKNNVSLALSNNISTTSNDRNFDGFSHKKNATYSLNREYSNIAPKDPDTMETTKTKYVVSPNYYNMYAEKIFDDFTKLGIKNVNLSEFGTLLNSDYSAKNLVSRTLALEYIEEILDSNKNSNISFNGCNAYVLKYAKSVFDVPTKNSEYPGETASVPFLQMCMGKNVEYYSESINLSNDRDKELLNCISTGTVPTYSVAYKNTEKLKNTDYTNYYAVAFNTVSSQIKDSLDFSKEAYNATKNASLVDYEILKNKLTLSRFDNGVLIVTNVSDSNLMYKDNQVKANNYIVIKEGN